jgi:hypothetical protein
MPRKPATITQADVARTLRAFDQAGIPVEVTLEPDGRVRFTPVDPGASPPSSEAVDYDARVEL